MSADPLGHAAERRVLRGEKGDKGDRGPGLSPRVRRALVVLFLLPSAVALIAVIGVARQDGAFRAAQHREQVQQERQGRAIERKLCLTMGKLAARRPPSGNGAANPSRAYLQWLHATLAQLGPDIGCK